MKCTTNRQELLSLLGKLESVAKGRYALPVLNTILVKAEGRKLSAWSDNLEVILTGSVKARVQIAGSICLPLSIIPLLQSAKSKDIVLSVKGKKVNVELGNISSTLDGTDAAEFPSYSIPMKGRGITVTGLAPALGQIAYAITHDPKRPVLNGVCFSPYKGGMELVATDAFRLGLTKVSAKGKLPGEMIIPDQAIQAIQKYMKTGSVIIRVEDEEKDDYTIRRVSFSSGGLTISAMAIRGAYPKYKQLIPNGGKTLKVATQELADAVKTLSRLNLDTPIVRLKTSKKTLVVSALADGNETRVQIPGQGYAKTAYEPRHLLDVLKLLGKNMELKQKNPSTPGMFKHNGTIHLLMPKFVRW